MNPTDAGEAERLLRFAGLQPKLTTRSAFEKSSPCFVIAGEVEEIEAMHAELIKLGGRNSGVRYTE